ncbi:MAG TPA: WG repeat-containing protein, partial [Flavobacterium sp.]
ETLQGPTSDKVFDFENGIAFIKIADKVGMMNSNFKIILEPKYDLIKSFENGYARVKNNDRWGIIDETGKVIVEVMYDDVGTLYKNTTWAKNGDFYGLVSNGKFIALDGVDKIWDFRNTDITYAKKKDRVGFIDLKGNWVIEPKFDKAKAFVNNIAPVAVGKKWGYINKEGSFVIEPKFEDAEIFSADGLAPVKEKNWGFIDKSGKMVIPTQYGITAGGLFSMFKEDEKGFVDGIARVKNDKLWGFINKEGQVLGNQWFENAELFN